ncbi:unnamed protein product, partial [marine sediment metagenome]
MEGNYVEYRPILKDKTNVQQKSKEIKKIKEKRSLKDIYDEFWEFIDNNNSEFKDFISKDKRRLNV